MGSANINQRSLDGARDTELAIGHFQPFYTHRTSNGPTVKGQVRLHQPCTAACSSCRGLVLGGLLEGGSSLHVCLLHRMAQGSSLPRKRWMHGPQDALLCYGCCTQSRHAAGPFSCSLCPASACCWCVAQGQHSLKWVLHLADVVVPQ